MTVDRLNFQARILSMTWTLCPEWDYFLTANQECTLKTGRPPKSDLQTWGVSSPVSHVLDYLSSSTAGGQIPEWPVG